MLLIIGVSLQMGHANNVLLPVFVMVMSFLNTSIQPQEYNIVQHFVEMVLSETLKNVMMET